MHTPEHAGFFDVIRMPMLSYNASRPFDVHCRELGALGLKEN